MAIGVIFIVHGWTKITGGKQMAEAMSGEPNPGMATMLAVQGIVEVAAGALVAVGLITQIAAIPLIIIMIGAIALKMVRLKTGVLDAGDGLGVRPHHPRWADPVVPGRSW